MQNEDIGLSVKSIRVRDWEHMRILDSTLASGFEVSIAAYNPVHLGASA